MENEFRQMERAALDVARTEMGQVAWGTLLLVAGLVATMGILLAFAIDGSLPWFMAVPLLSLVYYASYTPLHEAVHRNVSGDRPGLGWLDAVAGFTAGLIVGVPYTLHRSTHFAHHRHTNDSDMDPDNVFQAGRAWDVLRGSLWIVPASYVWYFRKVWQRLSGSEKRLVIAEFAAVLASRLVPALLGFPMEVLIFSIIPNLLGVIMTATLFAWIVHRPHDDQSRWGCTSTFDFAGTWRWPVTIAWLWQNYHSIHHLFPRVPFYRYHKVFRGIEATMMQLGAPIHRFGQPAQPVLQESL